MSSLTCPNCHHILAVRVVAKPPKPGRTSTDVSPLTDKTLADVFEFMKSVAPLEASSAAVYQRYLEFTTLPRPLSKTAFAVALQRNGGTRWRTAQARGYTIGEIDPNARPATMSPAQRERFEAAHQRHGVEAHVGGTQPVASGGKIEGHQWGPDSVPVQLSPPAKDYSTMTLQQRLAELPLEMEMP